MTFAPALTFASIFTSPTTLPKMLQGLASPCNIFAKAIGDVKALAKVKAGAKVNVTLID